MTDKTTPETETKDAEPTARGAESPADPPAEPVIADPPNEPAPKFRLVARERIAVDEKLTTEEKLTIGEKANARGERVLELEEADKRLRDEAKDEMRARREEIADAKAAHKAALEARHSGVERRWYDGERRAMVAAATIDLIRLDTGAVVETRAMSEAEQARYCRQGTIDEAAGGATIVPDSTGKDGTPEPAEPPEPDTRNPHGWPLSWAGKTWTVQAGDDTYTLEESGVHEVWIQLSETEGRKVKDLVDRIDWMPRQAIARAVKLLESKGLARCGEGKRWVALTPSTPAAEVPAPGKADPLPESGDIVRPRLQEPETVADAMLADGVDASATYAP